MSAIPPPPKYPTIALSPRTTTTFDVAAANLSGRTPNFAKASAAPTGAGKGARAPRIAVPKTAASPVRGRPAVPGAPAPG
eukprot:192988-Alexandrium_andersonii.AAC.1